MDYIERNLCKQPIADIMQDHGLKSHDLVSVSEESITHKMVNKACKGRRLTPKIQAKIQRALNKALESNFKIEELFNY